MIALITRFYDSSDKLTDGKYHLLPSGELLIHNLEFNDRYASYRCRTMHKFTRQVVISNPAKIRINGRCWRKRRKLILWKLLSWERRSARKLFPWRSEKIRTDFIVSNYEHLPGFSEGFKLNLSDLEGNFVGNLAELGISQKDSKTIWSSWKFRRFCKLW